MENRMKNQDVVWIMCDVRYITTTPENNKMPTFVIGGVFITEEEAVDACTTSRDCILPVTLGEVLPRESVEAPGAYYPLNI